MPAPRKRSHLRRAVTDAHVFQLFCGHDFFGDAYGDRAFLSPTDWLIAREEMRLAWQDPAVRTRVRALRDERGWNESIWAEAEFGVATDEDEPYAP